MCVLALAWKTHPRWRLVCAGNRDELHARLAAPLAAWDDTPGQILAGRDLQSGGTWLGVSQEGRFAVVTNLRTGQPPTADAPSRGLLLRDLLSGQGPYAHLAKADLAAFNPLNLLTVAEDELVLWSNRPAPERRVLPPGLYGLSNATLDVPWPKTVRLKAGLADWLAADDKPPDALLDILAEDAVPATGDDPSPSPIFVRNPAYGTRCSTIVGIDQAGQGVILERRFDAGGEATGQTRLAFAWPSP